MTTASLDLLLGQWEAYQATGQCDELAIAPPIARSWQRCVAAGLDPRRDCEPSLQRVPALDEAQAALVALARPYMEDLYQFVEGSGFAVLLADAALMVIEIIGDADMLSAIRTTGLARGSSWREDQIGSMALNMALHEALPWQTRGAEHFCACYHQFACSAAPLFDIGGQAMGVIGVLGRSAAAHSHTLGMVIAATQAIQAQVRNNMLLVETNVHLAELNAAIEAMSEGLIFLDALGHISKINARAGQVLGLAPRSVAGRTLEDLLVLPATLAEALEHRREISEQELLFPGRKGAVAALCSVRPVWDRSRRYIGALITLRPSESVQRLVQRVVGAEARFSFADIVGESPAMQAALRHARVAANASAPVLLIGEPGAGKELFAHAIHNAGARSEEPFVLLNCAAVPRTLLMGELLGYEGGQPGRTAARQDSAEGRPGKLELAHGGTLLLQDVDALTVEAQTSLLRVIETKHLIRIGGQRVVAVDARVIATTNSDLERAVAERRFRAELFYRLSVLTITIPPLRDRGDDVLLLIDQLIAAMNLRSGRQILFAPDALGALSAYPWPGNVRELEATLERLLQMTEKSVLTLPDLPAAIAQAASSAPSSAPLARLYDRHAAAERDAILRAGREAAGHLGHAAERLGISRATLWRKMKLYGLTKEHFWPLTAAARV
jgi:transcriptional activator for dhaKLM operon